MELDSLLEKIKKIEHGFKHIIEAGDQILEDPALQHLKISREFLADESYQVRMLGTYILGALAPENPAAMTILETQVAMDQNWRVQEMLAKAFDNFCKINGYEKSLPMIRKWLGSKNENVKRAVVEGLRIWTSRPYFISNPAKAIALISQHKAEESLYLRKSVGNALRDISKKHAALIDQEISTWDLTDQKIKFTHSLVVKG